MRTIGMKHGCRLRDRLVAAIVALAVPSIALADGDICQQVRDAAPGGSIQLKVPPMDTCDPTPIIIDLMGLCLGGDPGAVQGVTLPESPAAAGTAVNDGSSLLIRTVSAAPAVAVTIAVSDAAPAATTDGATADAVPPATVSVTDVLPGGGFLPAGSLIAVVGVGFQPDAQVLIDDVAVASTSWVDSSRIEAVTAVDVQLDGRSVTVNNPDGTGATYISYVRTTDLGKSARPLLAATEAIFPVQTQSSAVFAAPAGGTFFALALQNPGAADSVVSVELWDAGAVVASASLALPPRSKVSRDLSELFPGVVPGAESSLQVTATVPVQMLGLSGNELDGSVTPVLPTLASP